MRVILELRDLSDSSFKFFNAANKSFLKYLLHENDSVKYPNLNLTRYSLAISLFQRIFAPRKRRTYTF